MTLDQFSGDKSQELEKVILNADLSPLTGRERINYYLQICKTYGLNPLSHPFDYIKLNNKLVLYATKGCASALQELKSISVEIIKQEQFQDVWIVTVRGTRKDDAAPSGIQIAENVGITPIKNLSGDQLSNSIMKAVTKAQRRLILQMAGLGQTDESEIQSIANTSPENTVVKVEVDEGGEIVQEIPVVKEHDSVIRKFTDNPANQPVDPEYKDRLEICWVHNIPWYAQDNIGYTHPKPGDLPQDEPKFRSHRLADGSTYCQFKYLVQNEICEHLDVQYSEQTWYNDDKVKLFHNFVSDNNHDKKTSQLTDAKKLEMVDLFKRLNLASL